MPGQEQYKKLASGQGHAVIALEFGNAKTTTCKLGLLLDKEVDLMPHLHIVRPEARECGLPSMVLLEPEWHFSTSQEKVHLAPPAWTLTHTHTHLPKPNKPDQMNMFLWYAWVFAI